MIERKLPTAAEAMPTAVWEHGWVAMNAPDGYRFVRPFAITEVDVAYAADGTAEWSAFISGDDYCISAAVAKRILGWKLGEPNETTPAGMSPLWEEGETKDGVSLGLPGCLQVL